MTVDHRLVQRFRHEQAANGRNREPQPKPPLDRGGDGGDSGGMDGIGERVTRVEVRLDGVETRMGRIDRLETRLDGFGTRRRSVEQSLAAFGPSYARLARQLNTLVGEVTEQTERVGHALQVPEDVRPARVQDAAMALPRVPAVRAAVNRKLAVIRGTYDGLYAEASGSRGALLEATIVGLIVPEIVLSRTR